MPLRVSLMFPSARSPLARFLAWSMLGLLALAGIAHGQSVRWEPASGTLGRDQISQLSLVFEDAEPKDTPTPPKVDGLEFVGSPGRSEQSSFNMFGRTTVRRRVITFTYPVRPTRQDGEIRIPAFTVETDRGSLTVEPAGFRIAAATVGQSGLTLDQVATARFVPPAAPIWAGEVFRLGFQLEVDRRYATNNILGSQLSWTPSPFVAEPWSKPTGAEVSVNGQPRLRVSMDTRVAAPSVTTASMIPLPTASQIINLPTGQSSSFMLFGQAAYEQYTITTDAGRVAINPLPTPAPADFIGAVGQFKLSSKIVPEKAAVGEPITWTLTLEGTGNWPSIDKLRPRTLSRDFRVVTPRAQKTPAADSLFEATLTEDLVLIPQKPGQTSLGPYTISVFNPRSGAYETLRVDPTTIEITGPASTPHTAPVAGAAQTPPPETGEAPADSAAPAPAEKPAPAPVAKLPADPLPAGVIGHAPFPSWLRMLAFASLGLTVPLVLWFALAAHHAKRHDRLRLRREAHGRLREILVRLESASNVETAPPADLLLAWQHAVRALFELPSSTPTARDLPDSAWADLWIASERALYRPDTPLDKEWFTHAWHAHARSAPRARSIFAAFHPRHLFPRAALIALAGIGVALVTPRAEAAEDPVTLYSRGDFPAAEKAFRQTVTASPLNVSARHNLGLSLAQQGKWDEAAAHAYAAALQAPGNEAVERLLAATAPKASYRLRLPANWARTLDVHGWQTLAFAAGATLLTLVPIVYLLGLYAERGRRRGLVNTGHSALVLGALALVVAIVAIRAHGPLAHPDAVLVWRGATLRAVPTDAGDQKVTADLPPGTLARVDKEFLGWRRLVLADGNTGWVRAEPLVPLWR